MLSLHTRLTIATAGLLALATLSACAIDDGSGDDPPPQLSFDDKADGFSIPHKAWLPLEKPETLTIDYATDGGTPADFVYAEFALSGPATTTFETRGAGTKLYVYKQLDGSWWTEVASDPSKLTVDLDQGPYRLLLRRLSNDDTSTVDLTTGCTGDGCNLYTAFPVHAPQIVNVGGGPVQAEPRLTAVTFDGDEFRSDLETYVSTIGSSDYWRQTTSEYGIAPATVGAPVHLSEQAPATLTNEALKAWLASKLDGTHPEWGTPDEHSFYVLFYPATTELDSNGGKGCVAFGGYHDFITLPDGTVVVYAAIPRCDSFNGLTGIDELGATTAHELIEGVTDPQVNGNTAYALPDDDHFSWEIRDRRRNRRHVRRGARCLHQGARVPLHGPAHLVERGGGSGAGSLRPARVQRPVRGRRAGPRPHQGDRQRHPRTPGAGGREPHHRSGCLERRPARDAHRAQGDRRQLDPGRRLPPRVHLGPGQG